MSALPNPQQELASLCDCDSKDEFLKRAGEIVGTLLQAERAATIELILNKKRELYEVGSVQSEAIQFVINCLATPEAASALSAVVHTAAARTPDGTKELSQ